MRRNLVAIATRFPGFYRQDFLEARRIELGWSKLKTAQRAHVDRETTRKVLAGKATSRAAWPISEAMNMDFAVLHNFELKESEFRLAVRNGDSKKTLSG